jgi:hypothetical protein
MNRLCSGNALKLQASRKVGGLNLSQFFVNSLNSSMLISGYTSIRLIRLPLNRVQIIVQHLSTTDSTTYSPKDIDRRKINTNTVMSLI